MDVVMKMLAVLGLGVIELWAAIPAGLALQLHPLLTGIMAALGSIIAAVVVALLGERARHWIMHWRGRDTIKPDSRIRRIWIRYGVVGLGLLSPLITGAPLGAALGVTLGAPTGRLLLWMSAGIALWSGILTLASVLGLAGIQSLGH